MPTTAETSQVKRLLSDLLLAGGGERSSNKRQRVRFDDNVELHCSDETSEEYGSLNIDEHDALEEEYVDFVLSIGEDGDWDYTIMTSVDDVTVAEDFEADSSPCKALRPASLFAGSSDLCDELYTLSSSSHDEAEGLLFRVESSNSLLRVDSSNSLGNNLKISLRACNDDFDPDAAMPMPLITPPSSPRRVQTFSGDGVISEEATICEWPCNLAVDNVIIAASESASLALPMGTPSSYVEN
mmetsp:Transcript_28525/g.46316  ORF Transcript_28525/g.46316 Transcript_28525/m.46316 type:complete len:241 (-) Transcript_28525:69-791(-)|eukprot:CAMPEP_0196141718 /NCGR_PEP_ID=MMETSP0910-20130528/10340_1 /TAXON_ID=49265 /ORGANISM="Thalassiosira rotula, Strain GSO102" /LENGTH=240 /DNA_ID=CAMNT_0041402917 /DNA_START=198 /DNA_END=920 /DNA_ORIENTATION=+